MGLLDHQPPRRLVARLIALAAALLLTGPAAAQLADPAPLPDRSKSTNSLPERITQALVFPQRIVWVGKQAPSDADSLALLDAIAQFQPTNITTGLTALERFISEHPASPWTPSLHQNLAEHYRERGRLTLALQHGQSAWDLAQDLPGEAAQHVADAALANQARLRAVLGHTDQVEALAAQAKDRRLEGVALVQTFQSAQERAALTRQRPQDFVSCGPSALREVSRVLQAEFRESKTMLKPQSSAGYSLTELGTLAKANNLDMVPVQWPRGEPLPVPCVLHWQLGHYAAILSGHDDIFLVADPVFDHPLLMDRATLEAESSGFLLVPATQTPATWAALPATVTDQVRGNAQANSYLPDAKDSLLDKGWCPRYMMSWQLTEPYLNLWLSDSPLTYQPALGPRVGVEVYCKQRSQTPRNPRIFDIGCAYSTNSNWNLNWQTYLEVNSYCADPAYLYFNITFHLGDGGTRNYIFMSSSGLEDWRGFDYDSRTRAELLPYLPDGPGYRITYPDGRQDYFTNVVVFADGKRLAFRTLEADPQGHALVYRYQRVGDVVQLISVIDADGHTNAVNYYDTTTNLIKEIVDPSGHTNRYQHASGGSLTNITDMAGLSSAVTYDYQGWVTSLTTPYGTTGFKYLGGSDGTVPNNNTINRAVLVTEPNGGSQMFMFRGCSAALNSSQSSPPLIQNYPDNQIPTNTPLGSLDTFDTAYRNTFHWDQRQFAALSLTARTNLCSPNNLTEYTFWNLTTNDYFKARMSHWLFNSVGVSSSVSLVRAGSPDGVTAGPTSWFDYVGKSPSVEGYPGVAGIISVPSVIAQVLPDGSTAYSYTRYNPLLHPTNVLTTYTTTAGAVATRSNAIVYADNQIDVLRVTGPDGTVLARFGVDTNYHLVTAQTNAIGVTRYFYDSARRLTGTLTPSGLCISNLYYDTSADLNRLQAIVVYDAVGGTPLATNSYTYYPNGTVYTHTDERNLTTVNTWDALSRLTGTTYPDGTYVSNVYSRLDLTASRDRQGHWTYFGFDSLRRPIATTNALNQVTTTYYGPGGSPVVVSNAAGLTTMSYDLAGRLVTQTSPDTLAVTNTYNAIGQLYAVTDSSGYRVTNAYNNQGLVYASSNAVGCLQRTLYDIYDRPALVTDANGITLTNTYDPAGRILTRAYPPGGGVEQYGYSTNVAALTSYTNQIGNVTRYAYDALGRKTNTVAGAGTADAVTNSFVYNGAGDLLTLRDGRGHVTSACYDAYGRVTSRRDANDTEISRYQYDPLNHLTNRWSAAKGTTTYVYDPLGNLLNTIYPERTIQFAYDELNRLTNMVDAVGATRYSYDRAGLLLTEDGPWAYDTVTSIYTNRLRASLTLQQPGAPVAWQYRYDTAHRLDTLVSPAGMFSYRYPAAGATLARASRLPVQVDLPVGAIVNSYDGMARVTNNILRNLAQATLNAHAYAYNNASQRTRMTSTSAGNYVDYGYDALGQLTNAAGRELSGGALRVQEQWANTYDKAGNLAQRVKNQLTETFVADANDQLTSVSSAGTLTVGGTATPAATQVTVNGQNATLYADKTFAVANVPLSTTTVTATATDGQGHSASDNINLNATSAVGQFHYANLASPVVLAAGAAYYLVSQETAGGDTWYDYCDTAVTTTAVANASGCVNGTGSGVWYSGGSASQTYVPVDFRYVNGPSATTAYVTSLTLGSPRNEWSGYVGMKVVVGAAPVTVTALGRMMLSGNTGTHTVKLVRASDGMDVPGGSVSIAMAGGTLSPQYDLNGNLLTDGWRTFTYDTDNQLTGIVVTNANGTITQTGFVYDGKARRRIRTEASWQSGAWVTNQTFRYLYDGQRVIQERDANNTVLATYTRGLDLSQSLDGAGGIGGLLARTHPGAKHFYYHADANGNVTAIVNQNQTLVAQYRYDPFGGLVSQSGPLAEINLYRFSSKEFHPPSGLYYYGYRFYDPNLQRWLNRDPSGTKDGPNLYAFVHNRPVNGIDAWGLMPQITSSGLLIIPAPWWRFWNQEPDVLWGTEELYLKVLGRKRWEEMSAAVALSLFFSAIVDATESDQNADYVNRSSQQGVIKDANFAQTGYNANELFSKEGSEKYSKAAGRPIKTIDDLAGALGNGELKPEQVEVDYVVVDGQKVILNTRTSAALGRANIPQGDWWGKDVTGLPVPDMPAGTTFDDLAKGQTKRNKLPPTGTPVPPR